MDEDSVIERLRSGAEQLDADGSDGTDVDALVRGAVRQGRRRRTRRRWVGAGAAGLVAAALVTVVVGSGLPGALRGSTAVPAGPAPGTAVTAPAPTPSSTPGSSSAPTPGSSRSAGPTGRVSGSPAAVRATLTGLLPAPLQVTDGSAAREEGGNGFAWENNAALTVRDDVGTVQVLGGIGDGAYDDACFGYRSCERTTTPDGGTLWTSTSPPGDKTGTDRNFYYNRPDGGHVWLTERNHVGGNDPVTRTGLPISWADGTAVVTDRAWDALFRG